VLHSKHAAKIPARAEKMHKERKKSCLLLIC
jgi:hypothetical protein